ncbi:lipid II flippase Amj family protein [Paenibacillaceae bacterium WGS1546]|uniref:lipid II flippase Amj family protein n=1 Tax=Cohnella sp. WGS1546 TaxID=3366810 RepID=UPI00372D15F0
MEQQLIVAFAMTVIIHAAETLSYSIRLAGVRLNKIAVALSLTGIVVLVSRTANLIQAPLTAKFVDFAKRDVSFELLRHLRIILLASSVGTLIAIVLFPTFVGLFGRVIARLEIAGSLPRLLSGVSLAQLRNTKRYFRFPKLRISQYRYLGISKKFILLQLIVTSFYTVGVISSLYAAHLFPEFSTTASQASGIINGIATVLLTVFIDPQLGLITDKALNDAGHRHQLGKIYVLMMTTRFFGTMLAQLILIPAAYLIGVVVKWI